jgi:hypothetical protein
MDEHEARTWEYRSVRIDTELERERDVHFESFKERDERLQRFFSEMGKDGWELVGFLPLAGIGTSRNSWIYHAVFKRPS